MIVPECLCCNCSADIMRRLGRFNPCTLTELPDPVIDRTDVDAFTFLTKE